MTDIHMQSIIHFFFSSFCHFDNFMNETFLLLLSALWNQTLVNWIILCSARLIQSSHYPNTLTNHPFVRMVYWFYCPNCGSVYSKKSSKPTKTLSLDNLLFSKSFRFTLYEIGLQRVCVCVFVLVWVWGGGGGSSKYIIFVCKVLCHFVWCMKRTPALWLRFAFWLGKFARLWDNTIHIYALKLKQGTQTHV